MHATDPTGSPGLPVAHAITARACRSRHFESPQDVSKATARAEQAIFGALAILKAFKAAQKP